MARRTIFDPAVKDRFFLESTPGANINYAICLPANYALFLQEVVESFIGFVASEAKVGSLEQLTASFDQSVEAVRKQLEATSEPVATPIEVDTPVALTFRTLDYIKSPLTPVVIALSAEIKTPLFGIDEPIAGRFYHSGEFAFSVFPDYHRLIPAGDFRHMLNESVSFLEAAVIGTVGNLDTRLPREKDGYAPLRLTSTLTLIAPIPEMKLFIPAEPACSLVATVTSKAESYPFMVLREGRKSHSVYNSLEISVRTPNKHSFTLPEKVSGAFTDIVHNHYDSSTRETTWTHA